MKKKDFWRALDLSIYKQIVHAYLWQANAQGKFSPYTATEAF